MTSSPAQPQGIFFNRGGCNGTRATPVRTAIREVVTNRPTPIRTLWQNRPQLFRSSGCSGSTFAATTASACATFTERTVTRTRTVVRGGVGCTTCPNGTCPSPAGYQVMPAPEAEGKLGNLIEHAAVRRQLRVALRSYTLTPDQAKIARAALADPEVYEASVSKITHDLRKQKLPVGASPVGKLGDGTILKMLLDNLPQIIAAIEQILKLFGH